MEACNLRLRAVVMRVSCCFVRWHVHKRVVLYFFMFIGRVVWISARVVIRCGCRCRCVRIVVIVDGGTS